MQHDHEPVKFTSMDLAERWGVCIDHVWDLIRAGELRAIDVSLRPGQGKPRYRVDVEDVLAFELRRQVLAAPKRRPRRKRDRGVLDIIR